VPGILSHPEAFPTATATGGYIISCPGTKD